MNDAQNIRDRVEESMWRGSQCRERDLLAGVLLQATVSALNQAAVKTSQNIGMTDERGKIYIKSE